MSGCSGGADACAMQMIHANHDMTISPGRSRIGAFTAMELLMALSICSLVMLALSAILASVAQGWTHSENSQGYVMAESTGMMRIERVLRNCVSTAAHGVGSIDGSGEAAHLVMWMEDRQPNERIELGEVAILEHDRVSRTVRLWEIPAENGWYDEAIEKSLLDDPQNVLVFKRIPGVRSRVLAVNVAAMALWVHPAIAAEQKQVIEYALVFERPVRRGTGTAPRVTQYGSATMRVLSEPEG